MKILRSLFIFITLLYGSAAFGQQMILGNAPFLLNKSAVLELNSDKQGFLLPRISDTSLINTLNPPDGMMIYFVPTKQILMRANGYWNKLATVANYITGLSGDVTASGPGIAAATIANKAVTYAKIQDVAANRLLGRTSASAGSVQEITLGTGLTLSGTTLNVSGISGTLNYVPKFTPSGSLLGNSQIFDDGTNVGIGTPSPTQKLQVGGNLSFSGALMPGGTAGTANYLLQSNGNNNPPTWVDPATVLGDFYWKVGGNTFSGAGQTRLFGSLGNQDIAFITNNSERIRVLASGNVGINTITPGNYLEVKTATPASNVSGLRLNGLGGATPAAANGKVLSVNSSGDVIVTDPPLVNGYIQNQIASNQTADLRISGKALVGGVVTNNGTSSPQVNGDANVSSKMGIGITTVPNANLDVNGSVAMRVTSLTLNNTNNTNVNIGNGSFYHIVGPNNNFDVISISGGYNGRMITFYNSTANNMTIKHDASGGTDSEKIYCPSAVDFVVKTKGSITLMYNSLETPVAHWVVVSAQ